MDSDLPLRRMVRSSISETWLPASRMITHFHGRLFLCPCEHDFVSPDTFRQCSLMGQQTCPPDGRRELASGNVLYDLFLDERGRNVLRLALLDLLSQMLDLVWVSH